MTAATDRTVLRVGLYVLRHETDDLECITIGKNILGRRLSRGMTQKAVAVRAGCHPTTVGRAERGFPVRQETLEGLASALRIDVGHLSRRSWGQPAPVARQRAVARALKAHGGPWATHCLHDALPSSAQFTGRYWRRPFNLLLGRMVDAGLLRRNMRAVYSLTEAGERALL